MPNSRMRRLGNSKVSDVLTRLSLLIRIWDARNGETEETLTALGSIYTAEFLTPNCFAVGTEIGSVSIWFLQS